MKKKSPITTVVPLGNGWAVKNSNSGKFMLITDRKPEALSMATSLAKQYNSELIVHGKTGKIISRKTYAKSGK